MGTFSPYPSVAISSLLSYLHGDSTFCGIIAFTNAAVMDTVIQPSFLIDPGAFVNPFEIVCVNSMRVAFHSQLQD